MARTPRRGAGRPLRILALLLGLHVAGVAELAAAARDRWLCIVQFGVQDDRLVVRDIATRLPEHATSSYSAAAIDAMKPELIAKLDAILAFKAPLSAWALGDSEIRRCAAGEKSANHGTLAGRLEWAAASALVERMPGKNNSLGDILGLFASSHYFGRTLKDHTPLRLLENPDGDRVETLLRAGQVEFRLLDPVSAADVAAEAVWFAELDRAPRGNPIEARAGIHRETLSARLQSLVGGPWNRREIHVRIADYYRARGAAVVEPWHLVGQRAEVDRLLSDPQATLSPNDVLSGFWEEKLLSSEYGLVQVAFRDQPDRPEHRNILITEPRFVSQIQLTLPAVHDPRLRYRVLYALLDAEDWRRVRPEAMPDLFKHTAEAAPGFVSFRIPIDRLRQMSPHRFWSLFHQDLRWRSGLLQSLGYSVGMESGFPRRSSLHVVQIPREAVDSTLAGKPAENPAPSPASASDDLVADRPVNPKETVEAKRGKVLVVEKEFRHRLEASAEYKPGQGADVRGGYERTLLSDRSVVSRLELGMLGKPLGSLAVKKDFLFFEALRRRLAVDLKTYSDFKPEAPAAAGAAEERRSGAKANAEIEVFRAAGGHWMTGGITLQREYVELKPIDGSAESSRFDSSARLGATWFHKHPAVLGAPDLTIDAALTFFRNGDLTYSRWSVEVRQHRMIGAYWEAYWSAHYAGATSDAPVNDRPRLGGASTVRGYREDAAAGTGVALLRGELWIPLRGLEARWPRLSPAIRRQFAAVFVDAGNFEADGEAHTLAAVGVGLRIAMGPGQIIKLDAAHGFRSAATARAGTRLHLDVAADFPF